MFCSEDGQQREIKNQKLKIKMTNYKLTREQFADAVSKGLGRAMIYFKRYELDDVADIVLDACVHNKVYDAQLESGRADWLYVMFKNSPQYNDFREAILSALKNKNEWYDTVQLCELAKEMALDGDENARTTLKDFVLKSAAIPGRSHNSGVVDYIKVEGSKAVLELAKIYGKRLIDNPDDEVPDNLACNDEEHKKFVQLLQEHSNPDSKIKTYYNYLDKIKSDIERITDQEARKSEFLSQYNVERIIDCAKEGREDNRSIYRGFGIYADGKDLEAIFTQLLNEKDDAIRKRLLWVFGTIPLPVIHKCFFEWADSKDEKLQAAVFSAIANCKDDRVHEFARQRVRDGKILGWANSFVLDIFEKNFAEGDAKLITDAILASKPDKEDIHSFGSSITGIAEKNKTNELKELLLWVYENTPCSNCREEAIERLNDNGVLSQEIIEECIWDGSEEIREFAGGLAKQASQ